MGEILKVKPLAALAMIDEGELDWKIVAISLDDPKASVVNDVNEVEKHFPVSSFFIILYTALSKLDLYEVINLVGLFPY